MAKRISIVIPHLPERRKDMLAFAIENIESQNYKNVEIIVQEGWKTEVENCIDGLKKATGDIIHIHHDDDWLTPNALSNAVNALKGYDFIHSPAHEVPDGDYIPPFKVPTLAQLAKVNTIHNATVFYRADLFDRVGEYEQDWLFLLKCLEKGMRLGYCDQFLKYYRMHDTNLSRSPVWYDTIRPALIAEVNKRYKHLI